jgi:formiminotetrahydrofolate cyclodeaminase
MLGVGDNARVSIQCRNFIKMQTQRYINNDEEYFNAIITICNIPKTRTICERSVR